ncbi:unnamed protein product [Lepeophtheirus salmonis]|uniref:(salmon louse) hypothetical protein n=1 Tax=Lepeophtheirus salmonis TaxID=72036 RepID=A0A7R8HBK2_LEPSM|nr:unnamed protein product [Lepeophtheirus salmonis]CAF2982753.1 unnamed protein product [Lepeophtheirus salmonis]
MNYRLSSTLLTIFVMKFGQGHFQKFIHNNNDFEEVPINNTVTNIAKLCLRHLRHHLVLNYPPRKKCYKSEELCEVLIGKDRIMCTSFDKHFFKPNTNHFEVKNTTFYQPDINEQLHLASKSVKFLYHYFSTSTFCPMELKKISNMTSMRGGGTYYKFNLDLQTIPIEKGCEKEYRRCENVHIFKPNEKNCKLLDYDCLFPLDAAKVNCSTKKKIGDKMRMFLDI